MQPLSQRIPDSGDSRTYEIPDNISQRRQVSSDNSFSDGNQPVLSGKILAFRSPNSLICHFHHNFLHPLSVPRSRPTTQIVSAVRE